MYDPNETITIHKPSTTSRPYRLRSPLAFLLANAVFQQILYSPTSSLSILLPRIQIINIVIKQKHIPQLPTLRLNHHHLNPLQIPERTGEGPQNLLPRHLRHLGIIRKLLESHIVLVSQASIPLDVECALLRYALSPFDAVDGAGVVEAQLIEGGGGRGDAPTGVGAGEGGLFEAGDDGVGVGVDLDDGRLARDADLVDGPAGVVEAAIGA